MHDNRENTHNELLSEPTIFWEVYGVNAIAVFILVMQVTYFILVDNGCRRGTVWPARFHPKHANRGVKKKFHVSAAQAKKNKMQMQIVYRGRELIQSCWTTSPLLAPTHDLARMILIVNSIVRDTNRDDDAMHYALWGVLDELILLHNKLAKVSIFSLTEKTSTRETAKELISLLPSFKKRLDQRDFDFALMQKKRRRILFKLYVLGTFMNVEWWRKENVRRKAAKAAAAEHTRKMAATVRTAAALKGAAIEIASTSENVVGAS